MTRGSSQLSDWRKEHRTICKALQQQAGEKELLATSNPSLSVLHNELDAYWNETSNEICTLGMRSAFKFGRPDQCNRSHFLFLSLSYDSLAPTLRDRFTIDQLHVLPFTLHDQLMPGLTLSQLPTEGNPNFARIFERERVENAALGMVQLFATDKKTEKYHTICT